MSEARPASFASFAGLGHNLKSAFFSVIPACYDETSDVCGSAFGPAALLKASALLEHYDLESGLTPADYGIHTRAQLRLKNLAPEEMLVRVEKEVSETLSAKKFPLLIGGEHSITLGALRAFSKKFKAQELSVLLIDAHADLRDEYNETKFSHACVARRAREILHAVQAGVRSMSEEEHEFIKKGKINSIFYGNDFSAEEISKALHKNVYISIDLDALDLAFMPAVSCPEPDGMSWAQLTALISAVSKSHRIVGADIVELCPQQHNRTPDFIAAKLAYRVMASAAKQNPTQNRIQHRLNPA